MMEKQKDPGQKTLAGWFYAAVFCVLILSRILKMQCLLVTKNGLGEGQELFCDYIAYLSGTVCIYLAMRKYTADSGNAAGKNKDDEKADSGKNSAGKWDSFRVILTGGLWMLCGFTLTGYLRDLKSVEEWAASHAGSRFVMYLPNLVLGILQGILLGFFLMKFLIHAADTEEKLKFSKRIALSMRAILPVLVFGVLFFLVSVGYYRLLEVFVRGMGKNHTVLGYYTKLMLLSFAVFAVLVLPFCRMAKIAGVQAKEYKPTAAGQNKDGKKALGGLRGYLPEMLSPAVIVALLFVLSVVWGEPLEDLVLENLELPLINVFDSVGEGQYTEALKLLDEAEGLHFAWMSYIKEDTESMEEAYRLAYGNIEAELLRASLQSEKGGGANVFYQEIMKDPENMTWYFAYLKAAKKDKKKDADLQRQLLKKLVLSDTYSCETLLPGKISEKEKEKIRQLLKKNKVSDLREEEVFICAQMAMEKISLGTYSDALLRKWIETANEHPDYYGVQMMVLAEASGYGLSVDGWSGNYWYSGDKEKLLKEEMPVCAERYLSLYREILDESEELSEEDKKLMLADKILDVAGVYLNTGNFKRAQELLEKGIEECGNEEVFQYLLAEACVQNDDYQTAEQWFLKIYEREPEDLMNLANLTVISSRLQKYSDAVKYGSAFGKLIESGQGAYYEGRMLMSIVDLFAVEDHKHLNGGMAGYRYQSMSEEDKKLLHDAPLLEELIECEWQYYHFDQGKALQDEETAEQYRALENRVYALCEKYPYLSAPYYLMGKLLDNPYFLEAKEGLPAKKGLADAELALEYYYAAVTVDPGFAIVWYDMAVLYDYLEDYERCYQCALNAISATDDQFFLAPGQQELDNGATTRYKSLDLVRKLEGILGKREDF